MSPEARAAVAEALGSVVVRAERRSGGDINEAYEVRLADGRVVFVKTNAGAPPGFFEAEAEGLAWLAEAQALAVPRVLAVGAGAAAAFLALTWVAPGAPAADFDQQLGEGLAQLHAAGAPGFGHGRDNFIGRLPQANAAAPTWAEFYGQRRLAPLLERAARGALLDAGSWRAGERLVARLGQLVGPAEAPSRLHGDLWGGNLLVAADGAPVLIDPAVYAGQREVDLAMMRLFGGFGRRVFEAYEAAHPLAPGHAERVELYQLYPLLVHLCLFGRSYLGQVQRCLARYC